MLVYDGWQKVGVPISERDVAIEREKRLVAKARPASESKGKKRARKAKSTKKGKGRARGHDDESEDEEEDEEEDEIVDWCNYVNKFDVCITTYNVLQQDLGVARPPPTRPRRAFVQYSTVHRSRSPLVMCEWYRVIMDEVQMVGGGKTECVTWYVCGYSANFRACREMVALIPRLSSFAVSGTPARSQVADLIHVLKYVCRVSSVRCGTHNFLRFLRVSAVTDVARTWIRLQLPGYVHEFTELFRRYTVRCVNQASSFVVPS